MRLKCPFCGSSNIVVDRSNGIIVCKSCGTVIEDFLVDERPMRSYDENYTYNRRRGEAYLFEQYTSLRLLSTLRRTGMSARTTYAVIDETVPATRRREALRILSNKCVKRLLSRLKSDDLRQAVIDMLLFYAHTGVVPYTAGYAVKYGVRKQKLRKVFKKVIDSCVTGVE